jgi:hypothetical protein
MQDTIIGHHIRRVNRNLLWTNVAILAALIAVTVLCGRYLVNFFFGPFPTERSKLVSLKDGTTPFEYYIQVDYGDQKPQSAGQQVSQQINKNTKQVVSESVSAEFAVVTLSDKILLIKASPGAELKSPISGYLTDIPPSMRSDMSSAMQKHHLQMDDGVVPLMLDTTGFRGPGWWGLAIGLPLYCIAVWNIVRAMRNGGRLHKHPIAASLRPYGELAEVAAHIDQEVSEPAYNIRIGKLQVTPTWLLQSSTFGLRVVHIIDLIWMYKKVTKHSYNGIPTGTTHAVMINTRFGSALEVAASEGATEQLVEAVYRRAPWVITGFNDELAAIYAKDREGMIGAVDERREKIMAEVRGQQGGSDPAPASESEPGLA